jgi:hypothetical protein
MIKLMLGLVCFGSFLCTGNPWAAAAVIVLGWTGDEIRKAAAAPTPVKEGPLTRWMGRQVKLRHEARVREYERIAALLRQQHPGMVVNPGDVHNYWDQQNRIWGIKIC